MLLPMVALLKRACSIYIPVSTSYTLPHNSISGFRFRPRVFEETPWRVIMIWCGQGEGIRQFAENKMDTQDGP